MSILTRRTSVALASQVTGTLPLANGGTGTTTGSISATSALVFQTTTGTVTIRPASNSNIVFDLGGTGFVSIDSYAEATNFFVASTGGFRINGRAVFQATASGAAEVRDSGYVNFAAFASLYSRYGTGTPEGAVAAPIGAIFHRADGGAGTSVYVKESGAATNTGWVAK